MQINIYRDKLLGARLFGTPVLFSAQPIPREDVPQGWYCYDLRGTARHPDEPHALVDMAEENHAGSVLSYLPLKKARSQFRLVKHMFQMTGTDPSLAEFCAEEKIRCPETPFRYQLCPASPEDAGLFYAQAPEKDEELGAIGHVRIDFGHKGREGFYYNCFDKQAQQMGLAEKGRQALRGAADPTLSHSYDWYVIEHINTPERQVTHQLPLEEAMKLYASLDCADKRLGVTKDGIAAVDLAIHWEGREWLSEDQLKLDSFKDDPVVAEAVEQLQQLLTEQTPTQGSSLEWSGYA